MQRLLDDSLAASLGEIDRVLRRLGDDGEAVRGTLEREFARYVTEKQRKEGGAWRRMIVGSVLMPAATAALLLYWLKLRERAQRPADARAFLATDLARLSTQYAYWRGMVAHLMESGTYVVPVPGNHEIQVRTRSALGREVRTATVENENAWRANMGDLIFNQAKWQAMTNLPATAWSIDNAPQAGVDGITTDQRQLSYSFDVGRIHFAIINTDPAGFDDSAPVKWLEADFAASRQRGANRFFVFGHKMAFTYVPEKLRQRNVTRTDGLDARPGVRDAFWDLIESYQAIFFTGHQHVFHASQPRKDSGGKAWQVIVGSGGTNFSIKKGDSDNIYDYYYSWADVSVLSDNTVRIKVLGFDENFGPTRVIDSWDIQP